MKAKQELFDAEEVSGDEAELLEREGRIERAQQNAYYEIGMDLSAINRKRLYRIHRSVPVAGRYSYVTWEEYAEERWDWTPQRVGQLINAAEAAMKIETIVSILPSRETHVRELLKLEKDEQRAEVCRRVIEHNPTPRAKDYAEEVERFKAALEKNWYTVEEWEALSDDDRSGILSMPSKDGFNQQDNQRIEWAQFSWNPVTGCKHDCPYCYAREIAGRFYPQKFEPSFYPSRLASPVNVKVPAKAEEDLSYKNVFTCSMADIFGRWVPKEWIERVLDCVRNNAQWNFLFLTKFPQRLSEFKDMPRNAWIGTTVDCQKRVASAEKAFAKLDVEVKWLSIEPMLTRLKFKDLGVFDWVVMGGASSTLATPAWVPPFDWVADFHKSARDAKCAIYHKENLGLVETMRVKEFPWQVPAERELPEAMRYLGME